MYTTIILWTLTITFLVQSILIYLFTPTIAKYIVDKVNGAILIEKTDEDITYPKCFKSNPSYQAQAENDCTYCEHYEECF